MRANAYWQVSAEGSLKWCFCGFLFNLDNEYQVHNKASDDWEKVEVSQEKGIILLNESKYILKSISRKFFEVILLQFLL